ncbi:MAG: prepilin-type N-terminal cleavage/methylation domain-containing protein, partial [Verrucomicrobiota bacterium]
MRKTLNIISPRRAAGFTFVELVVAMVIGAGVILVAVLAYGAIARNGPSRHQSNVTLTNAVALYGTTNSLIAVSEAPSFAAAAMADSMRERLLSDISSASAVCCLARNKPNATGLRVTNLALPTNFDVRGMVTPDNFRTNLIEPLQNVYSSYSGATTNANLSLYILGYSGNATNVIVKAIYETDLVSLTNNPPGVYASVRRYVGPIMTDYYHVFY